MQKRWKPFDTSGAFRPFGDLGGLTHRALQGAGVNVFFSGISLLVQIIMTVILARLLTPHDFGVVAMVTTFSLLLSNFGVNGITEAVIQKQDIDDQTASNLFWIVVAGGAVLTAVFAAAGSVLAWFFGTADVRIITIWISATIFLTSISVLHLALLKRAMRFSEVSSNDLVAKVLSVVVSISLAAAGWGYWALVAGAIITPLSTSVGAWFLCKWNPIRPRWAAGIVSMLGFAAYTYGRFTVNYVTRNIDNLLVGWRFGTVSLGFYKRAYDLFWLPAVQIGMPLSDVALAAMSRLDPRSPTYRQHFMSSISILAFAAMGLSGGLTVVGKDLIAVLLGPKWAVAGRIFTFFGPGVGAMLIYNLHGWIHLSIGRADRWLRWGLIETSFTILLFVAGLPWGPEGVAIAWSLSFWILMAPGLWYAGRPIGFGIGKMLTPVWRYVLAAAVAAAASAATVRITPFLAEAGGEVGALARLVAVSGCFSALYVAAVILLHGGCDPIRRVATVARRLVPASIFGSRRVLSGPAESIIEVAEEAAAGFPKLR